jgi:hypothetical protein
MPLKGQAKTDYQREYMRRRRRAQRGLPEPPKPKPQPRRQQECRLCGERLAPRRCMMNRRSWFICFTCADDIVAVRTGGALQPV